MWRLRVFVAGFDVEKMHAGTTDVNMHFTLDAKKLVRHTISMTYEKREPRHPWRTKLTADERAEVQRLEAEARELRKQLAAVAAKLNPVRNRAIQRCRYEGKSA